MRPFRSAQDMTHERWRDVSRLFKGQPVWYRGAVGLMAVAVTTQPTLGFATPRQLLAGHYIMKAPARGYDVTPDGQRFVFFQARDRAAVVIRELSLVQNWVEELKRRVPTR